MTLRTFQITSERIDHTETCRVFATDVIFLLVLFELNWHSFNKLTSQLQQCKIQ